MELPKNITQVGEVGKDCKVYAEDYVISYMKQLNRQAQDKEIAVALYGRRREENGVLYFFLYGASRLTLLQKEIRHLSQAQCQEIERFRRKYFAEYEFLGYRLLDGDMIEGFHIYEQEICRYIAGYAQFYEKNDAMLSYMLDERKEVEPEQVDQGKYEEVKKRQEERRENAERQTLRYRWEKAAAMKNGDFVKNGGFGKHAPAPEKIQRLRYTAASVFVLLCLVGFVALQKNTDADRAEELQASAKKWVDGMMEQQLPENVDAVAVSATAAQKDVLVMEDKLDQAILEENRNADKTASSSEGAETDKEPDAVQKEPEISQKKPSEEETETGSEAESSQEMSAEGNTDARPTSGGSIAAGTEKENIAAQPEAVAYVIQTGDTLIGISRRQYGSDIRVADICSLNKISNPDDIKEGQVIMLPK